MRTMAEIQTSIVEGCAEQRRRNGTDWPRARVSVTGVVHSVGSAEEWAYHDRSEARTGWGLIAFAIVLLAWAWSVFS